MTKILDLLSASVDASVCRRVRRVQRSDGSIAYVRCYSKLEFVCPSCARLQRDDTKKIIGSGIFLEDDYSAVVEGFDFYFLTLTAPSFGAVFDGVPVDSRRYRYGDAVAWNAGSSALFHRTMDSLRDLVPDCEYSAVREYQKRGMIHFHILLRVPAVYDRIVIWEALSSLSKCKNGGLAWGKQYDLVRVDSSNASKFVFYMSKLLTYTSKRQDGAGVLSEKMADFYTRLDRASSKLVCSRRGCKADGSCPGRAHRNFGYGGYLSSESKGWSFDALTRKNLREKRVAYAEKNVSAVSPEEVARVSNDVRRADFDKAFPRDSSYTVNEKMMSRLLEHFAL